MNPLRIAQDFLTRNPLCWSSESDGQFVVFAAFRTPFFGPWLSSS
jgi:hypothetical protein